MTLETAKWDVVDYLKTDEAIEAYLEAVFDDGDIDLICAAIGDIARAKGMTDVAASTGLSRESLYKSLRRDGNPRFATVLKVLRSLDVQLKPVPRNVKALGGA